MPSSSKIDWGTSALAAGGAGFGGVVAGMGIDSTRQTPPQSAFESFAFWTPLGIGILGALLLWKKNKSAAIGSLIGGGIGAGFGYYESSSSQSQGNGLSLAEQAMLAQQQFNQAGGTGGGAQGTGTGAGSAPATGTTANPLLSGYRSATAGNPQTVASTSFEQAMESGEQQGGMTSQTGLNAFPGSAAKLQRRFRPGNTQRIGCSVGCSMGSLVNRRGMAAASFRRRRMGSSVVPRKFRFGQTAFPTNAWRR